MPELATKANNPNGIPGEAENLLLQLALCHPHIHIQCGRTSLQMRSRWPAMAGTKGSYFWCLIQIGQGRGF